jgi:hypothetical protein
LKDDKMDRACSTHGRGPKRSSYKENPDGRSHYGNLGVNGKIILK